MPVVIRDDVLSDFLNFSGKRCCQQPLVTKIVNTTTGVRVPALVTVGDGVIYLQP